MNNRFRSLVRLTLFLLLISACYPFKIQNPNSNFELENPSTLATQTNPNIPIFMNFYCVNPSQQYQTARVIKVIDGDSILVKMDGSLYEVRYIGINTPEFYSEERKSAILATQANERILFGQEVYLFKDVSNTDKFGRLLRYVFTENEFVNLVLIQNGFAESRAYPPDTACQNLFNDSQN